MTTETTTELPHKADRRRRAKERAAQEAGQAAVRAERDAQRAERLTDPPAASPASYVATRRRWSTRAALVSPPSTTWAPPTTACGRSGASCRPSCRAPTPPAGRRGRPTRQPRPKRCVPVARIPATAARGGVHEAAGRCGTPRIGRPHRRRPGRPRLRGHVRRQPGRGRARRRRASRHGTGCATGVAGRHRRPRHLTGRGHRRGRLDRAGPEGASTAATRVIARPMVEALASLRRAIDPPPVETMPTPPGGPTTA